ncbi:MAG: hypothetical protein PHW11_02585 [Anaerolineaceae bacterium]|jgi:hypothetical protein|nr:hypothetical protein [Anaerolineaceae bacterium]MDD4042582.1 hypothetical protein [Anaerolineaceae bacterium]MDD4577233.1 hypothetical protein [Anaerolineaceae bacterium]
MSETQKSIPIGKLLRAENSQFVAGCRVRELETPALGALVKVILEDRSEIFGLITNILINDDSLVRQLVSGVSIPTEYTADNRYNRNLPVEIHVLTVGYAQNGQVSHRLPPRPPLSLDELHLCDAEELRRFTALNNQAYLRHILRLLDQPVEEILASHLRQAKIAHEAVDDTAWYKQACQKLITLLREDYQRLTAVLDVLTDLENE